MPNVNDREAAKEKVHGLLEPAVDPHHHDDKTVPCDGQNVEDPDEDRQSNVHPPIAGESKNYKFCHP